MVCQSYTAMAAQSRACMLPFHEGSDLARLNVVAALTFFMQPVILVPLLLMYFFVAVGTEGVKVGARTRQWEWAFKGEGSGIDNVINRYYLFLAVAPPVLYSLLAWVLSGSFIFTLTSTFLLEACLIIACGVIAVLLTQISKWSGTPHRDS